MMSETVKDPNTILSQMPASEWVTDMHSHFRANGYYRGEDIQRVLGDPRECVQIQTSELLPLSLITKR